MNMTDDEIWHQAVQVGWAYNHIYGRFPTHFGVHRFHYQLEKEEIVFPTDPMFPMARKNYLIPPEISLHRAHFITLGEIHDEDEIRCVNQDATDWIKDTVLFDIITRHTLGNQ